MEATIAGLVLGAIPLLISALEHYDRGLDPLKAFFQWKGKLSESLRELWHEHTLYTLTLRLLLKDITTPAQSDEMMTDPRSELWTSGKVVENIQAKLGFAYEAYFNVVKEMEDSMKMLSKHLDIARAGGVNRNELEALIIANPPITPGATKPKFEFRKRLDFTMKRREVAQLLKRLQECNKRLDDYLQKVERFSERPATKSCGTSTFSTPLTQIQEYANKLHDVLTRSWSCSDHSSHCANLLLEHRIAKRGSGCQEDTMQFTVSLFPNPSLPLKWQDAEIHVVEKMLPQLPRVRFDISPPNPPTTPVPYDIFSSLRDITDICTTIRLAQPTVGCLGFCLDMDGKLRGTYPIKKQRSIPSSSITLEDILARPPTTGSRAVSLSQGNCYLLAVIIASSFLQLHTTPWIKSELSKEDIIFLAKRTIPMSPNSDGAKLLKLGVLLLEVFCRQTIEDRKQDENLNAEDGPSDVSDLGVLRRWIRDKQNEGSISLASKDAVSHCISCFADPRTDLKDPDFRKSMIDKVIVPLLDELYLWKGGP
ncbi:hypothetical protein AOQ84DRAFT_438997 [Glonium stellatum]|uniref:DUF7580 domain-containing protein n=1 Tax=Glonium stellatum TaxID=574774 RepID=A0A8E2F338_9PEZI|nr:hypothetical protein AOQ84DRAFT_438997 [Glonium stellatum]